MVDLTFIGKEGIIISYEDIVSLIGYNIAVYMRDNHYNDTISNLSNRQLMLDYVGREEYDIKDYLKKYGIEFSDEELQNAIYGSITSVTPTNLFPYKIFSGALDVGVTNLCIYSKTYSKHIEGYIKHSFEMKVSYVYGDIVPVIKDRVNWTFVTADLDIIRYCTTTDVPLALTICDDFKYLYRMITEGMEDKLKEKDNIFLGYVDCLSAGLYNINLKEEK